MRSFHPRLIVAVLAGLCAYSAAMALGVAWRIASLGAWNLAAAIYLALVWRLYLTADDQEVRDRAARWDEPAGVIALIVLGAMTASLTGVFAVLASSQGVSGATRTIVVALAAATLISSWFVVQSLFVGHYAHRHFQDVQKRGKGGGFLFPGDAPARYTDFAYLAFCVGATAQVSDPGVQSRPLRNLVTAHAVAAFFYNTAILALGVNILSSIIGH